MPGPIVPPVVATTAPARVLEEELGAQMRRALELLRHFYACFPLAVHAGAKERAAKLHAAMLAQRAGLDALRQRLPRDNPALASAVLARAAECGLVDAAAGSAGAAHRGGARALQLGSHGDATDESESDESESDESESENECESESESENDNKNESENENVLFVRGGLLYDSPRRKRRLTVYHQVVILS